MDGEMVFFFSWANGVSGQLNGRAMFLDGGMFTGCAERRCIGYRVGDGPLAGGIAGQ